MPATNKSPDTDLPMRAIQPDPAASKAEIDLEAVNTRLRELDELKNTFVALVSHELRTPVQLIVGYLEMGIEMLDPATPAETRQCFETARVQTSRLIRIVQELTDFARLQRNPSIELVDPITLRQALVQVFTLLAPGLKTKEITPAVELPRELQNVKYDGESLIIIFRNLLSNSA